MILSRPSRLNCGSHFFTTSADLLLSSSMTSRVTYVPFFSDHHSVSIILCSPLDHEPWRDRTEYLIPISPAICSVLGTWQMLKKCGQMNDDTWMNEQMLVQSQIWCICHLLAQVNLGKSIHYSWGYFTYFHTWKILTPPLGAKRDHANENTC